MKKFAEVQNLFFKDFVLLVWILILIYFTRSVAHIALILET